MNLNPGASLTFEGEVSHSVRTVRVRVSNHDRTSHSCFLDDGRLLLGAARFDLIHSKPTAMEFAFNRSQRWAR